MCRRRTGASVRRPARDGSSSSRRRVEPAASRPRASPRSGPRRRRSSPSGARARARRRPCPWRRRAPCRAAGRRAARRGSGASAGPARTTGCSPSGRSPDRAARRASSHPYPCKPMGLEEDLERIAGAAAAHGAVTAVLAAEPASGLRRYLVALGDDDRRWLVLDDGGAVITQRDEVRDTASIVAMCELAEDLAGGGDLEQLRSELARVRIVEQPPGIE